MLWAPPRLICSADTSILNIWFGVKTLRPVVKECLVSPGITIQ
jgi:hypothetical protein